LPERLGGRVMYRAASALDVELAPASFDVAVFSWAL